MAGDGHVWQGECVAGGMHGGGHAWLKGRYACMAGETATASDSVHRTGMYSCIGINLEN